MNDPYFDLDRLIDLIRDGTIDRKEFLELEARLLANPALRRKFRSRMRLEANLHAEFQTAPVDILPSLMRESPRTAVLRWALVAGMAAMLALAAIFILFSAGSGNPEFVAAIVSEDGAAWSGGGMVGEGGRLVPGSVRLEKGVASVRFESGVIADLEAPVTIELLDPMRCRLSRGKAVFEVPDSAIGFIVETPNGYAVDHGTRFAVALQQDSENVEFGVLSGRISVHHDKSQAMTDVRTGGMVRMTPSGIGEARDAGVAPSARLANSNVLRFRANGSETSIVHGDLREDFLDPELLMVKRDVPLSNERSLRRILWPKDRRALIAFELDELDGQQVEQATLRLNMVPSGRGYAVLLPQRTTVQVYGIRDAPELEQWDSGELKWADAPGSLGEQIEVDESEVSLLGSFEIERSQLEGPVAFESPELTRFVNQDRTEVVAFLLLSTSMPQEHWGLVHAFASSRHMEAAGPLLEIRVKPPESRLGQ